METRPLDRFFRPERIVVFGANRNPKGVGTLVLSDIVDGGFPGAVYPISSDVEAVHGIHTYADITQLPRRPDLAVVCSAAAEVPAIVRQCGEIGIRAVIVISAGFGEAGESGRELEARVLKEVRRFEGMRMIGPNCLGLIIPENRLNVSFALGMPKAGSIALVSQSGALCTALLDQAIEEEFGFSFFVSIGNAADVGFADIIDHLAEDDRTRSLLLYIESVRQARPFLTAARVFSRTRPLIAYKAGRHAESARAAGSHTGAMAGEDPVWDAALRRAGVARVQDVGQLFDCAKLLARTDAPAGGRLAIVTNAGGPGVMAVDSLLSSGGTLAKLSEPTLVALDELLPPMWSGSNPVDVLGDARPRRFAKAVDIVSRDPGVDAILTILTPQAMTRPTATARALATIAESCAKPILATWLGGSAMREGTASLNEAGVTTYGTPERAIEALMTLVSYSRNLDELYETPREVALDFVGNRRLAAEGIRDRLRRGGGFLTEIESKQLLANYGIPVVRTEEASSADEAMEIASRIGYPVALKILSPDIVHKSDVGGVALHLEDAGSVRIEYERMVARVRAERPGAVLKGVSVQAMVRASDSIELIAGCRRDPIFGPILLIGAGGVAAEILQDRALGLPPLNERHVRRMLEALRCWPLLAGYRGQPASNVDGLVELLLRLSHLVTECPEIEELDMNPLLVGPTTLVALDARILPNPHPSERMVGGDRHLSLSSYPERLEEHTLLDDGTPVVLRPIRPEDEPLWVELLTSCTPRTLHARFGYLFRAGHSTATRYCAIDYDRELAMAALIEEEGTRKLIGVGRLVADVEHAESEYAVLVADAWQNRGLGAVLTGSCIRVARGWGIHRLWAQTEPDNTRMVTIFEQFGFDVAIDSEAGGVNVRLDLASDEPQLKTCSDLTPG